MRLAHLRDAMVGCFFLCLCQLRNSCSAKPAVPNLVTHAGAKMVIERLAIGILRGHQPINARASTGVGERCQPLHERLAHTQGSIRLFDVEIIQPDTGLGEEGGEHGIEGGEPNRLAVQLGNQGVAFARCAEQCLIDLLWRGLKGLPAAVKLGLEADEFKDSRNIGLRSFSDGDWRIH